jgi:hypothetical protein
VLRDVATGEWPVLSYGKQISIVEDTRIPALASAMSVYTFTAPSSGGPVTITAELRFRRAFQAVLDAKGWDKPDIVMERAQATLSVGAWWELFLPVATRSA